ncbi:hypothetical protein ACFSHQ_24915 [Gemmobacter lanyuensis]
MAGFRKATEGIARPNERGLLMPHVLVAGQIHPSGLRLLQDSPDVTFDLVEEVSEPSYAARIGAADALILRTQPLRAATIAEAGRLKIVSRHGVGFDAVDVAALEARGSRWPWWAM